MQGGEASGHHRGEEESSQSSGNSAGQVQESDASARPQGEGQSRSPSSPQTVYFSIGSGQSLDCPDFQLYITLKGKVVSDFSSCRKADGIYQSFLSGVTLSQFVKARTEYCYKFHAIGCCECKGLIQAANEIISSGIVHLANTFRKCFPSVKYQCHNAKRKFLQLPVVIFEISAEGKGSQRLLIIEQQAGVNYVTFVSFIHKLIPSSNVSVGINKETLDGLCKLATTESDQKLIKYAACASKTCL